MIAARVALLAVSAALASAVWGALQMSQQPSAQRLVVTSVVALLAPLFWPGAAASELRTGSRITGWSLAAAAIALCLLFAAGRGRQSFTQLLSAGAMLALVLAITHTVASAVERRLQIAAIANARELAGLLATVLLALVGAMPFWLGPAAELAQRVHAGIVDVVVAGSPLTHLAIASGNDLLRNEWLYDHSNLAKLAVTYPRMPGVVLAYVVILLALALLWPAQRNLRRRFAEGRSIRSTRENVT